MTFLHYVRLCTFLSCHISHCDCILFSFLLVIGCSHCNAASQYVYGLNIFLCYCYYRILKHVIHDLFKVFHLVIIHVLYFVYNRVLHYLICSAVY